MSHTHSAIVTTACHERENLAVIRQIRDSQRLQVVTRRGGWE